MRSLLFNLGILFATLEQCVRVYVISLLMASAWHEVALTSRDLSIVLLVVVFLMPSTGLLAPSRHETSNS